MLRWWIGCCRLGRTLLVPSVELFKRFINWTIDYDGFGAELVKSIPILLMYAFVLYPWYTLPLWITAGVRLGSPLNFVVYALWWTQFVLACVGSAVVGYLRNG